MRDEVLRATGNKQEPFIYGSLGGDDVMLAPLAPVATAPPAPAPALADSSAAIARDYEFAERVGTKEAWDLFIATHKEGFYTELAKAQRNKLAAAAAPRLAASAEPQAGPPEARKPAVSVLTPPAARQDIARSDIVPKPEAPPKLAAAGPVTPALETVRSTPAAVAAPSSCMARIAAGGAPGNQFGGPFIPVSIRPDVEGAKVRTVAVSPTGPKSQPPATMA